MTYFKAPIQALCAAVAILLIAASISAPAARAADHANVVGGTVAAQGSLPSMAYISTLFADGTGETCSGTVVAPTLILTAAHCVESLTTGVPYPAASFQITTGLANANAAQGGWSSGVSHVYVNPNFHIGSESGDAALLQLSTPTGAPVVALATAAQAAQLGTGTTGILAGWGKTSATDTGALNLLRDAQQTVLDLSACSAAWGQAFDPTTQLCALNSAQTAGACQGDSGGALLANAGGTTVELGVTIFVAQGCTTTTPTVYTSATAIDGWVQSMIAAQPAQSSVAQTQPAVAATLHKAHHRHTGRRRHRA